MRICLGIPFMLTLMLTHLILTLLDSIHLYEANCTSVWVAMLRPLLAHMLILLMSALLRLLTRILLGSLPLPLLLLTARAAKRHLHAAICLNLWVATLRPLLAH